VTQKRRITADEARRAGATLGLDWAKVDLEQFRRGLEVELEHGARDPETNVTNDDLALTGKIAWAHLKEFRDYYERLDKLEAEADAYWASRRQAQHMISRVWHGWTTPVNADAYEQLLKHEIFEGIVGRAIPGFRNIELLRRDAGDLVEFVTIMWFDTLDAVRLFAGEDYEVAVVPPAARALLARFDARSAHYEVRERRDR